MVKCLISLISITSPFRSFLDWIVLDLFFLLRDSENDLLCSDGIKSDPQKVEAINAMLTPANCEDSQRFLGVVTYPLKFIPNMSQKMNGLDKKLKMMHLQALRKPSHLPSP